MITAMPRLPSSIGFSCQNPGCANLDKSLARQSIYRDDDYRWRCPVCHTFLRTIWLDTEPGALLPALGTPPVKDPKQNAVLGGMGGAALGLAIGGPLGALVFGTLGAGLGHASAKNAHSVPSNLPTGRIPVFFSFAFEDIRMRDLFVGQARHPDSPWEIADHSAHEPFSERWKSQMRRRILRSHVVVQLVSRHTHQASGAIWEVETALELGIPAFGVWVNDERGPVPSCFRPEHIIEWTRDGVDQMLRKSAALKLTS